jgi:two-component system sensor histidine kinase CreC
LLYVVVIGLACAGLLWWTTSAIRLRYLESMEESLVDTAFILSSLLEKQIGEEGIEPAALREVFESAYRRRFDARIYSIRKTEVDLRVYATDARGIVVYDSDGGRAEGTDYSRWNDVARTLAGSYGARATLVDPVDASTLVIHVAAPIRNATGDLAGVLTVGKPTTYINQLVEATSRRVLLYGIAVSILLLAVGWFASAWLTRPIERLTAHARALRDGRPSRLPPLSGPEVHALGRALEEMRDALEGRDYVENYVQALTHQIKAPLSALRGAAELLQEEMPREDRDRFLAHVRTETERIQRIVERLLQLAAVEKRKGLEETTPVDLGALVAEVVAELEPVFAARCQRTRVSAPTTPCTVLGEHFLLRQALLNLLHNASEFAPAGSVVEIQLHASPDADRARLLVRDRGPGVPDYALAHVFDRFYSLPRPGNGAKSSGLGLSLVREIAHLHGGTVTLENHPEGGALATLALPSSTTSSA